MIEKAPEFEFSDQVNNIKMLDALIALEIPDFKKIEERLRQRKFEYQYLNENGNLFTSLIS